MKLLITGSRAQLHYDRVKNGIAEIEKIAGKKVTEILHGDAIGNDQLAKKYANENELQETAIKPNYGKYGKSAPLKRNDEMIKLSDATLAIYATNKRSGGTMYTANRSKKAGKLVVEMFANGTHNVTKSMTLF